MLNFTINDEEYAKIEAWDEAHTCTLELSPYGYKETGAIGGHLHYEFTITSLGIITKVRCTCGEKLDLTEYERW